MVLTLLEKGVKNHYVAIMCLYAGAEKDARATLQPLYQTEGCVEIIALAGPYSYLNYHLLDYVDGTGQYYGPNLSQYKLCRYIKDVPTIPQLQAMVDWFVKAPHSSNVFNFESYGAQIANPTSANHSFVHRKHASTFVCNSYYDNLEGGVSLKEARAWCYDFVIGGAAPPNLFIEESYQNYPNEDYPNWEEAYFGPRSNGVFDTLQRLKTDLDPGHVFKYPHGIPPDTSLVAARILPKVHGERQGRTIHDFQNGKEDRDHFMRVAANITTAATRTTLLP